MWIWTKTGIASSKLLSHKLPGGTEENLEKHNGLGWKSSTNYSFM